MYVTCIPPRPDRALSGREDFVSGGTPCAVRYHTTALVESVCSSRGEGDGMCVTCSPPQVGSPYPLSEGRTWAFGGTPCAVRYHTTAMVGSACSSRGEGDGMCVTCNSKNIIILSLDCNERNYYHLS